MGGGGDYQNKWEEILEGAGFTFSSFWYQISIFAKKQPLLREKLVILKRYDTIKTSQ